MDVYVNQTRQGGHTLLAVCDRDLLGKQLKQGTVVFHVREEYYGGNLVGLEEAMNLIRQSAIVNMVGSRVVARAISEGLVHPDAVLNIQGTPHAQIVKV